MKNTTNQPSTYNQNVIVSNQEIKKEIKTVNGALKTIRELTTNQDVLLKVRFLLKSATGDQFKAFEKTVRFNKNGSTCVFYVLQALNKYSVPKKIKQGKTDKPGKTDNNNK